MGVSYCPIQAKAQADVVAVRPFPVIQSAQNGTEGLISEPENNNKTSET